MPDSIVTIDSAMLSKVFDLIEDQTFLSAEWHNNYVLGQSVLQRMDHLDITDADIFYSILRQQPDELQELAREFVRKDKEYDKMGFRSVFRLNPLGIAICSLDNVIIDTNEAFVKLFGYTKEDLTGYNFSKLYPPDTLYSIRPLLNQLLNKELEILEITKQYKRKDDTVFISKVWVSIIEEDGNQLILSCFQDITDQYEQEQETKEKEERYEALFNNSLEGIIVIDFDKNKAIDVNPRAVELFGSSKKELLVSNMANQSPEFQPDGLRSADKVSRIVSQFRTHLKEISFEWQFKKGDSGNVFDAIVTFAPITLKGEYAAVMFINDLTERKKSEEQIKQQINELDKKNKELQHYINSNLELESFAYVASHDLKQPLRSISSFTQLLKKRYQHLFDETADEYMDFITTNVNNMGNLIKDLLDYSRVNTKELDVREIDMNTLAADLVYIFQLLPGNENLTFNIEGLPTAFTCNPTKLKQVFQNLISNAIKFQQKNTSPKIEINGKDLGNKYQFSVKDNGIGIEKEYIEKIFLVFQRLHTTLEYEGSGIGLAICKKIIEHHGGKIWVESTYGEGSTFHFTLKKGLKELVQYIQD